MAMVYLELDDNCKATVEMERGYATVELEAAPGGQARCWLDPECVHTLDNREGPVVARTVHEIDRT